MDFLELFDAANLPYYDGGWSKCCTGHDCSLLSRFPGCLIVELLDYRPPKSSDAELENPDTSRVVLTPNDESRWADMCLLSQKASSPWTDSDAIEMEARILVGLESLFLSVAVWRRRDTTLTRSCAVLRPSSYCDTHRLQRTRTNLLCFQLATAPPLCLEPDIHLARVVNATQRVSTPPAPLPLKRKASAIDQDSDEVEKDRRLKIMQFMNPQRNASTG